ncbi:MAG: hypothetical protein WDZ30_02335 [Cellvibrionaceae bacterium]
MLQPVDNQDITETLSQRENASLEDDIFIATDKVQALCDVHAQLELSECEISRQTRVHYALVLQEQVDSLRRLLDKHFV